MSGRNRNRAIMLAAKCLPPVGTMRGGELYLDLKGPVLHSGEGKPGINAIAVEAALLRNSSASHVHVSLDSEGGSVKTAERIYTGLRAHRGYKIVRADGLCASAATIILMAGDFRTASAGTQILIHSVATDAPPAKERWTASKHKRLGAMLQENDKKIVSLYAARTGRNAKMFAAEIQTESFLTAARAKRLGMIHCLSGEETWRNGRPIYSGDEEFLASMRRRVSAFPGAQALALSRHGISARPCIW